ncbi:hypothetical protein JXB11_05005 [Candidatus Woesearchaeota archaeon]|nr:hypothetical protein [Candidatus Woesearchaeota archaeon]
MDKKGTQIMAGMLTKLVAALLVLAIILYISTGFLQESEETNYVEACKDSVKQNAYSRAAGLNWATSIKCPTKDVMITEKDSEAIKKEVADYMYECWDIYGKGKYDLFPTERANVDTYCVICSRLEFKYDNEVTGFWRYLNDYNAPRQTHSYYTDFKGSNAANAEYEVMEDIEANTENPSGNPTQYLDKIDTNVKYGVIFVYSKETGLWDRWTDAGIATSVTLIGVTTLGGILTGGVGLVVLGVAGAAAGAAGGYALYNGEDLQSEWQASIHLVPYHEAALEELHCTELPVQQ